MHPHPMPERDGRPLLRDAFQSMTDNAGVPYEHILGERLGRFLSEGSAAPRTSPLPPGGSPSYPRRGHFSPRSPVLY